MVSVEGLPSLEKAETYSCFFQDTEVPASFASGGVSCPTPDADSLPPIRRGDGRCPAALVGHRSLFCTRKEQRLHLRFYLGQRN